MRYFYKKDAEVNEVQMAILLSMLSTYLGSKKEVKDFILSNKKAQEPKKHQTKSEADATFGMWATMATEFKGNK